MPPPPQETEECLKREVATLHHDDEEKNVYTMPHVQWAYLFQRYYITNIVYPTKVDRNGRFCVEICSQREMR